MNSLYTCYGHIKEGKLVLSNRKRYEQEISKWSNCVVELKITKKNRRSNQANRYYWGIVIKEIEIRLKELGNDFEPETIHEFLKDRFNKVEVIGEGGEIIDYIGGSTANMNKEMFGIYLDKIIEWSASFLQITIPLPGSKLEIDF